MAAERWVAFLRGINVGANHRLTMADLRAVFESVGHRDVSTILQSGNVVFTAGHAKATAARLGTELEAAFEDRFGFASAMVLRTHLQLATLPGANPYLEREPDLAKVQVAFAATAPTAAAVSAATARNKGPEEVTAVGPDLFVWFPNGAGRSTLRLDVGVPVTFRNWNTVLKALAATA